MDTEKFVVCDCIYINYKGKQKQSLCCQKSEWHLAGCNWPGGVSGVLVMFFFFIQGLVT